MVLPSPKFAVGLLLITIGILTQFQIKIDVSEQKK